jgi:hypothetical protein
MAAPDARAMVEPPAWLKDAAKAAPQAVPPTVPAVVLLHDERITIESDGRIVTSVSHAARVLTRAGRAVADATEIYRTDTGKVRQLHGWMIPATGAVREYADRDAVDLAMVNNDLYNEARVKRINAAGDAQPGSVFGYESQTEDRAIFTQFEYAFQYGLPTQLSRFSVTVPAGWRVESVTFNHATIRPEVNGSTYTWQLDNLPQIEDEPASQELSSIVARIGVNVFPPSGTRAAGSVTFGSWQEVSKWLSDLSDPQVVLSNDLVAKAKALTVGSNTDYDRVAAIGKFVQGITYVSIQTGIGRGGGYKRDVKGRGNHVVSSGDLLGRSGICAGRMAIATTVQPRHCRHRNFTGQSHCQWLEASSAWRLDDFRPDGSGNGRGGNSRSRTGKPCADRRGRLGRHCSNARYVAGVESARTRGCRDTGDRRFAFCRVI